MRAYLVMDGQWGSTGKGLIAGYLAKQRQPDGVVCNFGPNAGHTFVDANGSKVMTQQLPTGIVADSVKSIFIGPGAIIDMDRLEVEYKDYAHLLKDKRVFIHERAAIALPQHRAQDKAALFHISSTAKGVGSALADKTMRKPTLAMHHWQRLASHDGVHVVAHDSYMGAMSKCKLLQVESAQGYELGLSTGSHYPYCTSRDITPAQILSDCSVPVHWLGESVVTLRTFPIRVGDQYNDAGDTKIGTSGPVHDDMEEVTWDFLNVQAEKTTVTGKIRRVFTFSDHNIRRVLTMVGPSTKFFLNFCNYVTPHKSVDAPEVRRYTDRIVDTYRHMYGVAIRPELLVRWYGFGPGELDIVEVK